MNLAKNLRRARKAAGLSMTKLAVKAKVSLPFISLIESGDRNPTVATIKKLAKALGTTPSDLMK